MVSLVADVVVKNAVFDYDREMYRREFVKPIELSKTAKYEIWPFVKLKEID